MVICYCYIITYNILYCILSYRYSHSNVLTVAYTGCIMSKIQNACWECVHSNQMEITITPNQPRWDVCSSYIHINQSEDGKGTPTFFAESSLATVSQCHGKNVPRWISISTKTINHHPRISLLSPSHSFHPPLPHTSSLLSLSPLCFCYLSHTLHPPMPSSFFLFFKESGLSTSFCFCSFFRFKKWLGAGRNTAECCDSCPGSEAAVSGE